MAKWVRDPQLEHFLKKMRVPFEWKLGYKLSDIDFHESLNRQTRAGKKVDQATVNAYGVQLLDNSPFPGILVQEASKHFKFTLSGLHRLHAAKDAGLTEIDCYTVHITDNRLLEIIPRTVNALVGRRPDQDEQLLNALYLCDHLGLEPNEVCDWFGLKPSHITTAKRQQEVFDAVREEGVSVEGITRSMATLLSPLMTNRNVLKSAAKMAKLLPFTEALDMINATKAVKTEAEQLAVIRGYKKDFEQLEKDDLQAVVRLPRRKKFLTAFKALKRSLDGVTTAAGLQLNDSDIEMVANEYPAVHAVITKLMREQPAGVGGKK